MATSTSGNSSNSSSRFLEKVVLVTGGSRGIGESCVRNFVQVGGFAVFCAPKGDEDEGKMLESELNSIRANCSLFVVCDVTVEDQVKDLVEICLRHYNRLDCVVNCAGWHPPTKTIDQFTSKEFTELFNLNVLGTFLVSKYSLPFIRKTKGSIVNIASIVGKIGQERAVTYVATKGAVEAMTKAMAIDEGQNGVRINCISPGNISTPLLSSCASTADEGSEQFLQNLCNSQYITRLGTSDEVAKACLFLAIDATFCTGINLLVSGGAELGYGLKL